MPSFPRWQWPHKEYSLSGFFTSGNVDPKKFLVSATVDKWYRPRCLERASCCCKQQLRHQTGPGDWLADDRSAFKAYRSTTCAHRKRAPVPVRHRNRCHGRQDYSAEARTISELDTPADAVCTETQTFRTKRAPRIHKPIGCAESVRLLREFMIFPFIVGDAKHLNVYRRQQSISLANQEKIFHHARWPFFHQSIASLPNFSIARLRSSRSVVT